MIGLLLCSFMQYRKFKHQIYYGINLNRDGAVVRFISFMFILLLMGTVVLAGDCEQPVEDLNAWFMYYYQSPDPDRLPCALIQFAGSPGFDKKPGSRRNMGYFFAGAFERNPGVERYVADELEASGNVTAQVFFLHVLWYKGAESDLALMRELKERWKDSFIQKIIPKMLQSPPRPPLVIPQTDQMSGEDVVKMFAEDFDCMWAGFFGSGNPEYVRAIMEYAEYSESYSNSVEQLIGGTATWSLGANWKHEMVREIVKERAATARGPLKKVLDDIIRRRESQG